MRAQLIQGTKEWLDFRKDRIGGSDAPVIMKVSPYNTPYQLWLNKLGVFETEETEAMKKGKEIEPIVRDWLRKTQGIDTSPCVKINPERTWQIASMDGMTEDEKTYIEIKYANEDDHELAENGRIPKKYMPQLQHQLAVCHIDMIYYVSFNCFRICIVEVRRDEEYIKKLTDEEYVFWECLQNFVAPELTSQDVIQRTDTNWIRLSSKLLEVESEIERLSETQKSLRKELFNLCDNKNTVGGGICVSKVYRKGNIDYSQIPELKGVNLEQYRKPPISFMKITYKGE